MIFFTADQHYGHSNIIDYCNRPFEDVNEMDKTLVMNHNAVVRDGDTVVHGGDFSMHSKYEYVLQRYVSVLKGEHIFLTGSHDKWLRKSPYQTLHIWERTIEKQFVVVCHYAMRTWAKSHYNSYQLYGHSHGRLEPIGKQWDIGVDNNHFYPVSYKQIKDIMDNRPDNPNLVRGRK